MSLAVEAGAGDRRWIWGRLPDLMLGCGLGYMLAMPAILWLASARGLDAWPALVTIAIALVISGPHYGATLIRAYEERSERRKYAFFTFWVSLAILALTAVGLHVVVVGSLLLTLYLTWAPWHFAGQNYGLALIFLGRRGISVDSVTKRMFYLSFILSAVISVLPLHSKTPRLSYALEIDGQSESIRLLRLGIGSELVTAGLAVCVVLYVVSLVWTAIGLGRRAERLIDLLPAALLVATQGLWYSVPRILEGTAVFPERQIVLTSVWISAAHALQYLWITTHFAKRENPHLALPGYLVRATIAGAAIFFVPSLLFMPALLGSMPYTSGLSSLIASSVNLHHFALDGAIWKLRDGRVARALLRPTPTDAGAHGDRMAERSWLRPMVYLAGALGIAATVFGLHQTRQVFQHPELDHASKRAAAERLAWIGRANPDAFVFLAQRRIAAGDDEGALADYWRAVEIHPREADLRRIGLLYARNGRIAEALAANERALALNPKNVDVLLLKAEQLIELAPLSDSESERTTRLDAARAALDSVVRLAPGHRGVAGLRARMLEAASTSEENPL